MRISDFLSSVKLTFPLSSEWMCNFDKKRLLKYWRQQLKKKEYILGLKFHSLLFRWLGPLFNIEKAFAAKLNVAIKMRWVNCCCEEGEMIERTTAPQKTGGEFKRNRTTAACVASRGGWGRIRQKRLWRSNLISLMSVCKWISATIVFFGQNLSIHTESYLWELFWR